MISNILLSICVLIKVSFLFLENLWPIGYQPPLQAILLRIWAVFRFNFIFLEQSFIILVIHFSSVRKNVVASVFLIPIASPMHLIYKGIYSINSGQWVHQDLASKIHCSFQLGLAVFILNEFSIFPWNLTSHSVTK